MASPLLTSCGFRFHLEILYYERSSFGCTSIVVSEVWATCLKERKFFQIPVIVSNLNFQHIKSWFRHITKGAYCYGDDSKLHIAYISQLSWNVLVFLLFRGVLHVYMWSVVTQRHAPSRRFISFYSHSLVHLNVNITNFFRYRPSFVPIQYLCGQI